MVFTNWETSERKRIQIIIIIQWTNRRNMESKAERGIDLLLDFSSTKEDFTWPFIIEL